MMAFLLFFYQFKSYGSEHLLWLLYGIVAIIFWIWLGNKQTDDYGKRWVGMIMSLLPALCWLGIAVHKIIQDDPIDLNLVLPFHVCYFVNLCLPIMMWRKSYALFEVFYFVVMAGCAQALLTPDVETNFPEIIHIRYFFVHIGLVHSILYAIFVFQYAPTWRGLWKAFFWMNIYFLFAGAVNYLLGTNFMFLCHKPGSATLLDHLGEWPVYILAGEVLAIVLFMVVLLPFVIRKPHKEQGHH
jgi:hypothetical integral membrane protein (TIGR02206 family)